MRLFMQASKISPRRLLGLALAFVLVISSSLFVNSLTGDISATKEQDLRSETQRLEAEIAANEAVLKDLRSQALTLSNKLRELSLQIADANNQISLTTVEIESLTIQLDQAVVELNRQKGILAESLKTLYIEGSVSTMDLLLASEDFSDFVNQQEYLSQLKMSVQESTQQVQLLKESIEQKKTDQENLLTKQQSYRDELQSKRNEQGYLLNETKGNEQAYQAKVADLKKQKEEADRALNDYLASLIGGVSLGPIGEGEVIGGIGNTGYSSGPHLHFKIYTASTIGTGVNPQTTMNNFGWVWPVGSYGGYISQSWGCSSWDIYGDYNGCPWHDALDIAGVPIGTPVYATGSGQIIHRGCLYSGIFRTYGVIINHENGYYSLYIHMKAPPGAAYDSCRANTYPW